jgi:hypothetical protein
MEIKKGRVQKYPPMENWPWVDIRKQDDEFLAII